MKHDDFLRDLHIGEIIKEIAQQNGVSSKQIAEAICRYQQNADKIFRLEDMDIGDIVRISYLLEYNILIPIAEKYLSNLPVNAHIIDTESYLLKIDMRTQRVITDEVLYNCDFVKDINIGQHIREIATKRGYTAQDMAKHLYCVHSTVCHLYVNKSLKVKKLIQISNILHYNFIAELYLPQMAVFSSLDKYSDYVIALTSQQVRVLNTDNTILMVFQRNDEKKQKYNRRKTDNKT